MNYSPQQIQDAFKKLPYPVRSFVASPELTDIVEEVGKKYGLHVDSLGLLNQVLTEMLVGLSNPTEFSAKLKEMGIPDAHVSSVVSDLNEKVFKPLQDKFKEEDTESAEIQAEQERRRQEETELASFNPDSESTLSPADPQKLRNVPPLSQLPAYKPATAPTSQPKLRAEPVPAVPQVAPTQVPPTPSVPEKPTMRTFASDVEQIKHGAVPTPQTYTPSAPAPAAPQSTPAPELKVHAPYTPPQPPPSQSSAAPAAQMNRYTPAPMPHAPQAEPVASVSEPVPAHPLPPRTTTPTHQEVTHSLKQYGIDPYREIPE